MALPDSLTLVDNSTGTPANIVLVKIATSDSVNNTSRRRQSPYDPAFFYTFSTKFDQNPKSRVITAKFSTQLTKVSGGISEFATVTTTITAPGVPAVLSQANLYGLFDAHQSFGKFGAAADASDLVIRLIGGEI